ncbi:ROK family protein [Lacticaseibacillus kribbianus]|uniref:ROK family protein n=1 Tax=Lacticaseibacillus kribbianus TaxID=2926292 RepID=UPI001CD78518|nr:ROK family protein [Lacticaseibacillus kribbianus]
MTKPDTVLAVDLGGTKILVGEVTRDGEVLSRVRYKSDVSAQRVAVNMIKSAITHYLNTQEHLGNIVAVGIGVVGRVDSQAGVWREISPELAVPIPITEEVTTMCGLPCFVANDVVCGTLAEMKLGIGQRTRDLIYINVGTGIAAGIVSAGHLIVGKHNDAGEIGHMVVDVDSPVRCVCGRYGCVEALASGLGMSNIAKRMLPQYPDTRLAVNADGRIAVEDLVAGYGAGDALAKCVIDQALDALACLTMNLVYTSNPQAVVFGGGVMADGWMLERLQPLIQAKVGRFVKYGFTTTTLDSTRIALKGCAVLAFSRLKGEDLTR